MLDLDGFKAVNDRFGHAAGDAALREVAERLRSSVRERDMVARAGGDEFVVVLPDLADEAARTRPPSASRPRSPTPLELDGVQASLHAAVGVACFPDDGDDADVLLAAADRAMYARKYPPRQRPRQGSPPRTRCNVGAAMGTRSTTP